MLINTKLHHNVMHILFFSCLRIYALVSIPWKTKYFCG